MTYRRNYPATVAEVLDPNKKYAPDALRVMRAFRASKPWQGTDAERLEKLQTLNRELARVYNLPVPTLIHSPDSRASSYYSPDDNTIVLCGKISVLTFLHEFCHARRMDEREACTYSINLFKRIFPKSYSRLTPVGHTLRRIPPAADTSDLPLEVDAPSDGEIALDEYYGIDDDPIDVV